MMIKHAAASGEINRKHFISRPRDVIRESASTPMAVLFGALWLYAEMKKGGGALGTTAQRLRMACL